MSNETATLEQDALKTKKTDLLLIDPRNIVVEENFNVREDYGDIKGLAESITRSGQIEPVVVSKIRGTEQYVLTDGHRRMRAILKANEDGANIQYVKAIVSDGDVVHRLLTMVITGADKKPLNNLEEGEAYKRLKEAGVNPKDIAARVGKSFVHVYAMLKLADAPEQIKAHIRNGEISGSTVSKLMKGEYETVEELIQIVEEAVLNAQIEDEEDVKAGKKKEGAKPKKATARHAGVMSPMKKLEAALDIALEKEYESAEFLQQLVSKLKMEKSTPQSVANLFK
jgi:ParB family chromosome partitioning protein